MIRTHGHLPALIAVAPNGEDRIHALIVGRDATVRNPADLYSAATHVWRARELAWTTACCVWQIGAWHLFCRIRDESHFALRTWWGDRIVLNLDRADILLSAALADPLIASAIRDAEIASVRRFLVDEAPAAIEQLAMSEESRPDTRESRRRQWRLETAIYLIGVHGLTDEVKRLRVLESMNVPTRRRSGATYATCVFECHRLRSIAQQALRMLDEAPEGYAACEFMGEMVDGVSIPQCVPNRLALASQLRATMRAHEVLALMGSPDFYRTASRRWDPGASTFSRFADWEYDELGPNGWETLRIRWEQSNQAESSIMAIDRFPAKWHADTYRDRALVGF
ncbi:MAG: hypothetical protein H6819_03980 [Phycisphaerales bacterium]|nr:hypothetical protein [Phycisphaerales bacterium]MCB9856358.1 hypothetical protein [Phycisphaerales bacterium]MCB9864030.1 hypothetical protein [Phycisphaerales bacterium]